MPSNIVIFTWQQRLILIDYKTQVNKVICSSRLIWKTAEFPLPIAFRISMYITTRLKSINHVIDNIRNQCSWWDIGGKTIFEWLSLSFELATKPGVLQLMVEAGVFLN